MDFTCGASEQAGRSVITCSGELDAHAAPQLAAELDKATMQPSCAVVVDLSSVEFMDSTGLGVLVTGLKHVRESDGTLDVVVASPRVLKVLQLTGLDVVIPLHETLESALAAN